MLAKLFPGFKHPILHVTISEYILHYSYSLLWTAAPKPDSFHSVIGVCWQSKIGTLIF